MGNKTIVNKGKSIKKNKNFGSDPKIIKEIANYFCPSCNTYVKVGVVELVGSTFIVKCKQCGSIVKQQ